MAKATQETEHQSAPAASGELKITVADLQAILKAAAEQNAEQTKAIVEAIKSPVRDKNQEIIDQTFRDLDRESERDKQAGQKARQEACGHFQGSNELSSFTGPLSSIVRHQLDSGELVGICTNCQKIWRPGDPEYRSQINRKSGNTTSKAGQRFNSQIFTAR